MDKFAHFLCFFFFKQKTAYEMRISDWSSDVCSSDLQPGVNREAAPLDEPCPVDKSCDVAHLPPRVKVPLPQGTVKREAGSMPALYPQLCAASPAPGSLVPPGTGKADRKSTRLNSSH